MKLRTFVLAILGAMALAACGRSGTFYEKTPEQVRFEQKYGDDWGKSAGDQRGGWSE